MTSSLSLVDNHDSTVVYKALDRYAGDWVGMFRAQYAPHLKSPMTILDVGSGRTPVIPPHERPGNCTYLGLDISAEELALAPAGSYDQVYVHDLAMPVADLVGRADMILSWQVLEHIKPLSTALENIRSYLKPEGHFLALLSGKYAVFSVVNRLIPERIGVLAMKHLLKRPPESVFRAHYDACTCSELTRMLETWSMATVVPIYRGGMYFRFSKPLSAIYLKYEDWLSRTDKRDFATHYVIVASK